MDMIFIRGLEIETIIGIYEWERVNLQTVVLDLEMATDISHAARSERIEDCLDYKAISDRLLDFVGNSRFLLVETLAERIAEIVLTEFKVSWLRLTVDKRGAVPAARGVGLIIERGQRA
jgi:7,8-dihydroneopterin aldolase/epimerase/oxygenase